MSLLSTTLCSRLTMAAIGFHSLPNRQFHRLLPLSALAALVISSLVSMQALHVKVVVTACQKATRTWRQVARQRAS